MRPFPLLVACLLLLAACSGSAGPTTSSAGAASITAAPETVPPLQVAAWEGMPIETLCLEVEETYNRIPPAAGFTPVLVAITRAFDDDVTATLVPDGCDAQLSVIVSGTPLSAGYSAAELFTGADMDVTLTLEAEGREPLTERIMRTSPPPDSVIHWEGDELPLTPEDAPLWKTIQDDVCATFSGWFSGSPPGGDLRELLHNIMRNRAWGSGSCGGYAG